MTGLLEVEEDLESLISGFGGVDMVDILDFTTPGLGFSEDLSGPLLVLAVWDLDDNELVGFVLFPLLDESLLAGE